MDTGLFPEVKLSGRGVDHPPPSSSEVKNIVHRCLYTILGLRGLFWGELYKIIIIIVIIIIIIIRD